GLAHPAERGRSHPLIIGTTDDANIGKLSDGQHPVVARSARDTYRTFLLKEVPAAVRNPERRRATVPVRALFGKDDAAVHYSLAAAETARADDYTLEMVEGCGHFIVDERPELVRARLIELAAETA
ncbi:alpha/beta fold hydrolase, partial [Nocardia sp. NPDC004711]